MRWHGFPGSSTACETESVRVLVAMSGGVDSSVAAALLVEAHGPGGGGRDPQAVGRRPDSGCCSVADVDDARRVADQLGIVHHVFNFSAEFEAHVVDPYVTGHVEGRTPNPCIECNRHLKFDRLLARAADLGFDAVATGHHARVGQDPDGTWRLLRGADAAKDQSYVLSMLGQDELARTVFPVGDLTKDEVRATAARLGLRTAAKPDSQDVCFIRSDAGRAGFLGDRVPLHAGRLVDHDTGADLGEVAAVELVTVGQRRGMGHGTDGRRRFVTAVDVPARRVTIGPPEASYASEVALHTVAWVDGRPPPCPPRSGRALDALAQCSAHGTPVPCTVRADADGLSSPSHSPSGGWPRARPSPSTTPARPDRWSARGSCDERVDRRPAGPRRRPRRPGRRAPGAHRPPQRALPRARRPRDHRRRVRRARPRAARPRGRAPGPGRARLADRAGRRGAVHAVRPRVHHVPMMSLDNAFSPEELRAWADRVGKQVPPDTAFECELKIDGLAISLLYRDGRFVQAATRGDGTTGEDVTANIATVAAIPEQLDPAVGPPPEVLEVRGEVYMPIAAFDDLNRRQAEAGEKLFVNPRNSAAGSLRQKDPAVTATRALSFWAYQVGEVRPGPSARPGGSPDSPPASRPPWPGSAGPGSRSTPRSTWCDGLDEVLGLLRPVGGAPPRPRLRDRRRRRQGGRPGPPARARLDVAGPALGHRLQVPARGALHHACSTSRSPSGGPGRRRRSPCSSRSSSAGPPSASPPSTTRTRCG